jgi:hypothetical protein
MRTLRTRRIRYAAGALALSGGYLLATAPPAAAELVDPPGACVGEGTWRDSGLTVVSTEADPGTVIEIPRADQVDWTGEVIGPQPGSERPIAGSVSLALPPPLGRLTVNDWDGTGVNVATSGTESYDLPALVPAGVVFTLHAEHREGDQVFCAGTAQLRIAGGPFDSPLIWVALAGTALFGGLLALAGRNTPGAGAARVGRMLVGGLLGALSGWFLALTLLLLGLIPLASPLLTIAPLAGAIAGAGWGGWSRWGRPATGQHHHPAAVSADGR